MRFIIASFLLVCTLSLAKADKTPLNLDTAVFPSPNGKLVAKFEQRDDGWTYFNVTDSKTGKLNSSTKIELTPVFSLQWTRDSRSIVTVGHVAHGSAATLFHLQDGAWKYFHVFPSNFEYDPHVHRIIYDVTKVEAEEHHVNLTYRLTVQTKSDSDDTHEKNYSVKMLMDPNTDDILTTKCTPSD